MSLDRESISRCDSTFRNVRRRHGLRAVLRAPPSNHDSGDQLIGAVCDASRCHERAASDPRQNVTTAPLALEQPFRFAGCQ